MRCLANLVRDVIKQHLLACLVSNPSHIFHVPFFQQTDGKGKESSATASALPSCFVQTGRTTRRLCPATVYCVESNTNIKCNSKWCPHVAEGPPVSGSPSCCLRETVTLFLSSNRKRKLNRESASCQKCAATPEQKRNCDLALTRLHLAYLLVLINATVDCAAVHPPSPPQRACESLRTAYTPHQDTAPADDT